MNGVTRAAPARLRRALPLSDLPTLAPTLALVLLMVVGAAVNPRFLGLENLLNMVTQSSFISVIGIGATFVIAAGGLDLSVGSMAAFIGGVMILLMNALAGADYGWGALATLLVGCFAALVTGGLCGAANGLIVTVGRIESFIVTLGTMGIFRALITYLAQGGSINVGSTDVTGLLQPFYFGFILGVPVPVVVFLLVGLASWVVLNRTPFGRHVVAIGDNQDVARYSGIGLTRVRTITYVIQGLCVGIATILYVPRLSSATPSTGMLWELQAITAVVIGGTPLRGGTGRVWGTIVGSIILVVIGNIMILSDLVSEYLLGAVQGAIIIVAMLVQRGLARRR
jgi:ribose transport system permease protein